MTKPWVVAGREAAALRHTENCGDPECQTARLMREGRRDDSLAADYAIAGARLGYLAGLRAAQGASPGYVTKLIAEAEAGE